MKKIKIHAIYDSNTRAFLLNRLSFSMPQCLLKPLTNGILMGRILAAAPAAVPIQVHPQDKAFQSCLLEDINKSIKAAARTITKIKLKDKVPSDVVLWKAGIPNLNQAVSKCMATLIWKARHLMNPLGHIFETSRASMNLRSKISERLSSSIPGHPEAASNILANIWNHLDLKSAKSASAAKSLANNYFKSTNLV